MNQSRPVGADPQTAIPIGKEYPALHIRFQGFERVTANAKDPAVHGDPDIPVLVLVCFKGGSARTAEMGYGTAEPPEQPPRGREPDSTVPIRIHLEHLI